jgi:mRNA-degrading endonuclease RelE of RelBE toxin-antitoxin system
MRGEMRILYTDEFRKDVQRVKDASVRGRLKALILRLAKEPSLGKPLKYHLAGLRSLRVPPFRVIYELQGDALVLHKFEHRKSVYR